MATTDYNISTLPANVEAERSILAAPVRFERDTVGLLMVFAPEPFNFDEGDVAVAESLAHTVIRSMRQAEAG